MEIQTIAQLFDLSGRGAVVTGGAMGIGRAVALRLAEAGASVMIADIDLEAAGRSVEEIKAGGGKAQAIAADASSAADAKKAAHATVEAFGSLDILVNNAGIYPMSPLLDMREELWDRVLDLNLKGTFLYSQSAAQEMIKAGRGGKIINMASIDALKSHGATAHYSASKAGVVMLTKALALELAPHKVLVNCVVPGSITTPGTDNTRAILSQAMGIAPEQVIQGFLTRVPLQRMGEPDDVARVVLFLASAAADYMTGDAVVVDGGYLLS
jgi:2-deoxy-D-gluconate 3-dehydrogenase